MIFQDWFWRARVSADYIGSRFRPLPRLTPRICNICGYEGYFAPAGKGTRYEAKCPKCKSAERYRLFKLWLDSEPQALAGKDILHFAPEKSLSVLIRPIAGRYRTADIAPGRGDLVLNIEAIALDSSSLDAVIASHVLEHVEDKKALAELHRVLKPGGLAVIIVPIVEGWKHSYEDPSIVSPQERALHFGQWDHVRYYGADIRERIRAAGFTLDEFTATPGDVLRYSLIRGETLFLARKA